MKRRKRSHPEDTDVTLLSVCVSDSMASFNFARNPAKVSTEIIDKIMAFPDTAPKILSVTPEKINGCPIGSLKMT